MLKNLLVCFPESFPVAALGFELFDFLFLRGLSCASVPVFPLVFCSGTAHILLWVFFKRQTVKRLHPLGSLFAYLTVKSASLKRLIFLGC